MRSRRLKFVSFRNIFKYFGVIRFFSLLVFSLFLDSMKTVSTDVLENVTLPCLKVLANTIQKASTALDEKVGLNGLISFCFMIAYFLHQPYDVLID